VRRDRDPRRLSHPERVAHNHERVVTDRHEMTRLVSQLLPSHGHVSKPVLQSRIPR
jgi:hypothetical protein